MGYSATSDFNHLIATRFPWICAIWLHIGLFALCADLIVRNQTPTPLQKPITVELFVQSPSPAATEYSGNFTEQTVEGTASELPANIQTNSLTVEDRPDETLQPMASGNSRSLPEENDPVWIRATTLHADDVLSDPRSAQARAALSTLVGGDQKEQLCALEAMEQVRRSQPGSQTTRLAPHAFRNSFQRDGSIIAPAGAVRSNRVWFEIAYKCRLDTSGKHIKSFEFALGAPVERSLWDEHGLAPVH